MCQSRELRWPHALAIVRVVAFKGPSAVDFVSGVEIMIDPHVRLLADFRGAAGEAICSANALLGDRPLESGSVQSVPSPVIVRLRHHAEHLTDISGRIHLR